MNLKSIKEIVGTAMLGEGIVGLCSPKKYSLFWKFKYEPIEKLKQKAADNPGIMRLIYAAEACFGLWLAKSQLNNITDKTERLIKSVKK